MKTINDLRNPDLKVLYRKIVQQGHYPNENERVEAFTNTMNKWIKSQSLSQNNNQNPEVLLIHIKISEESEEKVCRLDGSKFLMTSADHPQSHKANLVLNYDWLTNFEMVIEYTDRVFDIKAPVSGLCIKTY